MDYRINPNLARTTLPPVAKAWDWARNLADDGRPLLDVAQAVPSYPPAAKLREHLAEAVLQPEAHGYSPILGQPALRDALAAHMAEAYKGAVAPDQIAIAAGCNQAFCLATSALAAPGDEIILPLPYYFNHQMWLEMQGICPVHLPFDRERAGVPDPCAAAERITARTRAIVLVTPNNPTGAVYPPEIIEAFFELARTRELALIVDETYKDFLPESRQPHRLFERRDWPETLIQLYSFSKSYALTGHRIGSITASERFLEEAMKASDTLMICPPAIGQEAARFALQNLDDWRDGNCRVMAERAAALREAFQANGLKYELVSAGAFFAYVRHPFPATPAWEVAQRLVKAHKVLSLPGEVFGPGQEAYLRFAFANLDAEQFPDLVARLVASQDERFA